MLKRKSIITTLLSLSCLFSFAQVTTHYARNGMKTIFDLEWTASNYGSIQWQKSMDGTNWTDIKGATSSAYEFTVSSDGLYRAVVNAQEECEPTYITRAVKTVQFSVALAWTTANTAVFELTGVDLKDAKITEYGFAYNLSEMNTRDFKDMYRVKAGTTLPSGSEFDLTCEGLNPGTSYSVRVYFKTEDGSLIYGPGRIAKTLPGLKWTNEDWIISKNSIAATFEIVDFNSISGNPNVICKFGQTAESLSPLNVENLGNYKYKSEQQEGLTPNTEYLLQIEATVDGEKQTLQKTVKTLPDYTGTIVDNTPSSVKHTIRWDATKTLHRISPEGIQTEYPRIIRLSEDTLLCSYHGGSGSDHWQNIYLQKSFDNGQTWTAPTILMDKEKSNLGKSYWRFVNPEMIKLENGWILMSFVGNGNPETNNNCHVMVMVSKDNGETWSDPSIIGRGRTWEPMILQLPNGELEMYVASEAAWYGNGGYLAQEIMFSRSTDNGQTWSELKRSSYSPDRRDGMPVGVVMQGNKGIMYVIEIVDDKGFGSPSLVHRALDEEWDEIPWDGISDGNRWKVDINGHGGAPYMIQLPTGEIVVSAHTGGRNGIWQTSYPRIAVGDSDGKNFLTPVTPLTNLPASQGAYYNSLFLKDNETVWLVITNSEYNGSTRTKGEIKYLEGKIIERK